MFDLLVLGAGPAGCAAAIHAASAGLNVALAERAAFPRDLPGEALHPDVDTLFDELGVSDAIASAGFLRYPGWFRIHGELRDFIPFGGPQGLSFGYQAWRADLDSLLLAKARRAGVMVIQPARVGPIVMTDGRVTAIQVNDEEVRFRCLVDASGAQSIVQRQLGLVTTRFSPKLTARYGYASGGYELGVVPEFHEHKCGWTWLARIKTDCCQFVQLALEGEHELSLPFDGAARPKGADVTWRFTKECAGPGYFLCGDAASVLDPAAPSGVARALESGMKAAAAIAQITSHSLDEDSAAHRYREWCAGQFMGHANQLAGRYALLTRPPRWLQSLEIENLLAITSLKF